MKTGLPTLIMGLIAAQLICAAIFLLDVLRDMVEQGGPGWGLLPEALASIALFVGIAFEAVYLLQLMRRGTEPT